MIECKHDWKEDELFKSGAVVMLFGDIGNIDRETRMVCFKCKAVNYVKKITEGEKE